MCEEMSCKMKEIWWWEDHQTNLIKSNLIKEITTLYIYNQFTLLGARHGPVLLNDRCLTDATNVAIPVLQWRAISSGGKQ